MFVDPVHAARLVTREVRCSERDGVSTRVIVARRSYSTDYADLWDALTNPKRLARWLGAVNGSFRVGGRFAIENNASGVIERCDEHVLLAVTWEYDGERSWVTVGLHSHANEGTTVLELRHEWPIEAGSDFYDEFGPGAAGVGWDLTFVALAAHVDPSEEFGAVTSDEWALSPDGTAFVNEAAPAWAAAAVADGDDPDDARAAAQRTIAFYTTDPDHAE